ncbi:MAG: GNAT family N-acetyltransferase [Proteobacteria bacterium]|nr:GNAT family N-acetyltransferase [Pseudomonadota bacterium]
MEGVRIVQDIEECEHLWKAHYPQDCVFDLWGVRRCFSQAYSREPFFILYEEDGELLGFLPLSRIEENGTYAFFPGETWQGKTWMEQNKILARDEDILRILFDAIPGKANVRYVCSGSDVLDFSNLIKPRIVPDEVGYLFFPASHGFSYDNYLTSFSGKSRKKILSEIEGLTSKGLEYRFNEFTDVEWVFKLNLDNFGESSYFYDPRFMEAFENLVGFLKRENMLRVVTVILGGKVAAVDIGAIYNNSCTLLAGGTNREFQGVAKLINLHHMAWACQEKMESLDFLCGDFGWKERFRLSPRPLYQFNIKQPHLNHVEQWTERLVAYAS